MQPTVSSVRKKGVGYLIEVTAPNTLLGLYSFVKKILFYCSDAGCVDCKKYQAVRDPSLLKLLTLAYNNKKKQDNM
jgi:hypothetical protein